ncbi:MAG: SpoIIE family protein phosphatase, partial [Sulfuritalea sp.]|nr:SpoIIE family protein phosphatase [Sulfuritalea sp.]
MIRSSADSLSYRYLEGRNQLSFGVRWNGCGMAEEFPQRRLFGRRPERRTAEESSDGGRQPNDRRKLSIGWISLFRGANENAIHKTLGDCEVLLVPAGTPLLRPGETNHSVYILLSGKVAAHLDDNLNPDVAIPIPPGECIGELSAIDGKQVSALVLALTDARVLKLSREIFWNRIMSVPGVASSLMVTLAERMRRTNEMALKAQREQLELVHLRKELDVARRLQISMLPLQRPMFPHRHDIEVCGFMEPASQVGGDLFDAFFVDERTLFFCIGDVSGHGIAAALFMARTIGLLRMLAINTVQPDKLLELLNDRLCLANDANIFVTLFCGFLDVGSGKLRYSNAGHCAPIVATGAHAALLDIPKGTLIGAFPGRRYSSMEYGLKPGDLLFCYTDGVTEAQDPQGDEFSEKRCLELLGRAESASLSALLEGLRREVTGFTGSPLLDDDCTMLALRLSTTGRGCSGT